MLVILFLATFISQPGKVINWSLILEKEYKIPFGPYALDKYLTDLYSGKQNSVESFRELFQYSHQYDDRVFDGKNLEPPNYFSISNTFNPTQIEVDYILKEVDNGANFFIAANQIDSDFLVELGLYQLREWNNWVGSSYTDDFQQSISQFFNLDTIHFQIHDPQFEKTGPYVIRENDLSLRFAVTDSINNSVIATAKNSNIIAIRHSKGKGSIILSSTPLMFSNIYLLYGNNEEYLRNLMAYLPGDYLHYTEFYEKGKSESKSILRFILSQPALKWAYYLALIALVLTVIFDGKRRQRIIPIVEPPKNRSLEFVKTIGSLYYENSGHIKIVEKRAQYFYDFVLSHYHVSKQEKPKHFIELVSKKSGISESLISKIVSRIDRLSHLDNVYTEELESLSNDLNSFYKHANNK